MLRIAALALLLAGPAAAQEVGPWTEAVVSVRDLEASSGLLREAGGWRVTHRGRLSRGELQYWNLPERASGRFVRVCAPMARTGCVRFVRFSGVAQRPIRLATRPWDTGGIFSLMVRSDNVQALFDQAISSGWWAESEPIAFSFGGSALRNVVLHGPDGFSVAAYERTSPPFTAFSVGRISQAFNSMRMVRDQRTSVRFYREGLGFAPVFDQDYRDPAPGPSNFSLPHDLTTSVIRRASALQPTPGETGRVEVMEFVGLTGKDVSAFARAPNLGVLSLRYPVRGLAAYRDRLRTNGVAEVQAGARVPISGVGTVAIVAVADPDGAMTEFYETVR